jgi:hypothetical protein
MAQVTSGFSTESTQYAYDNSYYVLDSVPGSGDVLQGPITVTGNLTTTGNQIVQGSLGVLGSVNAPSVNGPAVLALTGATGLTATATTGNVAVTATAGTATVSGPLASGYNLTVNAGGAVLAGPSGKGMGIGALFGAFINNGSAPVIVQSPIQSPSYLNFNNTTTNVTRTGASAIVTTPSQFNTLKIDDVNSAPVTIPITGLYTGGCVPKFVKITMSPITFGSIITGSCSVTQPFSIYFYQGSSTSWDVISSQALATFTYTNQVGTINTVGSYVTIPSVTFPAINGSQIDPAGGPIQVWYYTYFQGFFGPASGTQTTFSLSVAL